MTYAMWDTISAKQMEFMRRREKYIAYGGARCGGKSWVARTKAVGMCLRYAGLRVLMVRKTFAQMRENIVLPMQEQFAPLYRAGAMRYNGQNNEVRFYNGSRIVFGYCDSDRDLLQYQGVEYDVIFLEEATQLSEYQFGIIRASLRGTNDYPKRMYLTCNPGGQGHAWVKRLFVDRQFTKDEDPAEYAFIQAKVYDNAVLMEKDPGYLRNLQTLPDGMRKAWLDGSWDVFEGQVFTEWRDDPEHYADGKWTHVIDEFRVPEWWKIWRGFDFGYAKPFSVGWYAADGDGKIYRIREWYGCTAVANEGVKLDPQAIAAGIREIERTDPNLAGRKILGVADPSIFDTSRGRSVADMMADAPNFVTWTGGDNSRLAGKMQWHYRLKFDADGDCMMQVFKGCREFRRTIPALLYDAKHPEDIDTAMEDHIYDECRYVLMENPISPRQDEPLPPIGDDPLNMERDLRREKYGRSKAWR